MVRFLNLVAAISFIALSSCSGLAPTFHECHEGGIYCGRWLLDKEAEMTRSLFPLIPPLSLTCCSPFSFPGPIFAHHYDLDVYLDYQITVGLRAEDIEPTSFNKWNSLWTCIEEGDIIFMELCASGCHGGDKPDDYCEHP
ncbi:hypothetical protein F4778DRAFT_778182 [Xylariomycetidae sp. FL2044]|nr:hypothetical protein F4778DRAFT_778182 [Xylariomycetidae sp. FL2044]